MTLVLKPVFWWALILFLFAVPFYRSVNRDLKKEIPIIKSIKNFQGIDQDNQVKSFQDFRKYLVLNLHFTRCPGECVDLMKQSQKLQVKLLPFIDHIHMISLTVDSEYDSVEVLKRYSTDLGAHKNLWSFWRAKNSQDLETYLQKELYLSINESLDPFEIAHSTKFVLIDSKLQIRGYYDQVEDLLLDFAFLLHHL